MQDETHLMVDKQAVNHQVMSPAAVTANEKSDLSQPKNQQEKKPKVQTEEEEEEEEVKIPILFNNFEGFADQDHNSARSSVEDN